MISWSSKHIALIAIFFFTAFAGVFTTNALCDLEIIEYAPNLAHNHSAESEDDHHNEKENIQHSHDSHSSSNDDPCCDDVTSKLESSLFNKIIKKQISIAKYFLLGSVPVSSNLVALYQSTTIIYHEYDNPPPLGGVNIRILMQSFLN